MALTCLVLALSVAPAQALRACPAAAAACIASASTAVMPAVARLGAVRASARPARPRVHGASASIGDNVPEPPVECRGGVCGRRRFYASTHYYSKSPIYLTLCRLSC